MADFVSFREGLAEQTFRKGGSRRGSIGCAAPNWRRLRISSTYCRDKVCNRPNLSGRNSARQSRRKLTAGWRKPSSNVWQLLRRSSWSRERRAKAEAEAEAKRKADAEQRRLADLFKAEQERRAKAETEAEAKRKVDAEQRRLADLKAEQERKAGEAERQRLAAVKAEQEPKAKILPAPSSLFTIQRDVEASPTGGTRNESLYSRSIGECEQTCAQRPTCNVFTYAKSIGAGACYLYTRAELKPNAGFEVLGIRNSVNQTASTESSRTA